MSSRSIISSSLGCKCSFDHSLHFVSIYQSQDSVNLKQQDSKTQETWASRALTASWRGGVLACLFSKLFTSKKFPKCCRIQLQKARGNFHSLTTGTVRVKCKVPAGAGSPSLLQQIGNRHRRESPPLAKPLLCQSMCKAPGADPQSTEVIETNRPNS